MVSISHCLRDHQSVKRDPWKHRSEYGPRRESVYPFLSQIEIPLVGLWQIFITLHCFLQIKRIIISVDYKLSLLLFIFCVCAYMSCMNVEVRGQGCGNNSLPCLRGLWGLSLSYKTWVASAFPNWHICDSLLLMLNS